MGYFSSICNGMPANGGLKGPAAVICGAGWAFEGLVLPSQGWPLSLGFFAAIYAAVRLCDYNLKNARQLLAQAESGLELDQTTDDANQEASDQKDSNQKKED